MQEERLPPMRDARDDALDAVDRRKSAASSVMDHEGFARRRGTTYQAMRRQLGISARAVGNRSALTIAQGPRKESNGGEPSL